MTLLLNKGIVQFRVIDDATKAGGEIEDAFNSSNQHLENEVSNVSQSGGRIEQLRVDPIDGRIIVHGRSGAYYSQQLALAVVMEAMKTSDLEPKKVEVDIQVCGSV